MAYGTSISRFIGIGSRTDLFRVAGIGAIVAAGTVVAAGAALALFFGGAGDYWGPVNDITTALTLVLALPAIESARRLARTLAGSWFSWLSLITVAGMLVAALGLILLVVRVIDLQGSFVVGGIGILPFLLWLPALAFLALRRGLLSAALGWLTALMVALIILSTAAAPFISMATLSLTLAPALLVAISAWLIVFGRDLLRLSARAATQAGGLTR